MMSVKEAECFIPTCRGWQITGQWLQKVIKLNEALQIQDYKMHGFSLLEWIKRYLISSDIFLAEDNLEIMKEKENL